jgi:acyl CoA:acetate/3-ketoacid CoA transferase
MIRCVHENKKTLTFLGSFTFLGTSTIIAAGRFMEERCTIGRAPVRIIMMTAFSAAFSVRFEYEICFCCRRVVILITTCDMLHHLMRKP